MVSTAVTETDEKCDVIWLDRIVLSLVDRLLNFKKEVAPGESLLGEFDEQLFVARGANSNRRRIWFDEESGLGDLTRLLFGVYLTFSVVLLIVILLALPETRTSGSGPWAAVAAILVSPVLGQAFWHGVVNEVRFVSPQDDDWGGVITIAPVIALCMDSVLATMAWLLLR